MAAPRKFTDAEFREAFANADNATQVARVLRTSAPTVYRYMQRLSLTYPTRFGSITPRLIGLHLFYELKGKASLRTLCVQCDVSVRMGRYYLEQAIEYLSKNFLLDKRHPTPWTPHEVKIYHALAWVGEPGRSDAVLAAHTSVPIAKVRAYRRRTQ